MTGAKRIQVSFSSFSTATRNLALSRGAPRQLFTTRAFNAVDYMTNITAEIGERLKTMSKQKQVAAYSKILSHTDVPFVACFSSVPNDARAAALALQLMLQHIENKQAQTSSDGLPLWLRVSGDLRDRPRIDRMNKPSLVILSNCPGNATQFKLEKVRDLLEEFNDVPRIVVTTGIDPLTMFWTQLYYTLNCAVYMTETRSWSI